MQYSALVIDDNENNRMLEKDLLEVAGFIVHEAATATAGIALARRLRPSIIVMDVRLPDMLGTDAAVLLRQSEDTKHIPIVFVTASVMADGMEQVRAIPNSGFISKPIDTRTFADRIRQFMACEI
jgi:two-component system, cell cycle response regulator DivK